VKKKNKRYYSPKIKKHTNYGEKEKEKEQEKKLIS